MDMVNDNHNWEHLICLMEQELDLLNNIAIASVPLKESLHRRDWKTLEDSFKKLEELGNLLGELEEKRVTVSKLISDEDNLDYLANQLDTEMRARFKELQCDLRIRLQTVKSRITGITRYADSRYSFSRDVVKTLYPSTRGQAYNRHGHAASGETESVVLSRHL